MAEQTKKATEKVVKDKKYYNELVTVKLFKSKDRSADVFVAVNGKGMLVPRGKEVQIPRKYAIALKNSQAQDDYAFDYIEKLARGVEDPELN